MDGISSQLKRMADKGIDEMVEKKELDQQQKVCTISKQPPQHK